MHSLFLNIGVNSIQLNFNDVHFNECLTGGRGGSRPGLSVNRSFSPPPDTSVATDNSFDATATSGARLIQVGQSADSELRDTLDGRDLVFLHLKSYSCNCSGNTIP